MKQLTKFSRCVKVDGGGAGSHGDKSRGRGLDFPPVMHWSWAAGSRASKLAQGRANEEETRVRYLSTPRGTCFDENLSGVPSPRTVVGSA